MIDLTNKQQAVYDYIKLRQDSLDPPTYREIAAHFGVNINAVSQHVKALRRKGRLTGFSGKARKLRVN